jgi:23S rRNA pseudouridine1911/1915/1917 synthase
MKARTLVATDQYSGLTILAALRQWLPDASWSTVRKHLAARRVLVNGVLCVDEARRIRPGDVIALSAQTRAPLPAARDVKLVRLDADIVVAEKPAGMVTLRHTTERHWSSRKKQRQPTLDDVLIELTGDAKSSRPPRVYSVHRIDRDTSGLLVFARNQTAQERLIQQFKHHTVERTYLAIAHGDVAAQTIESYLVDDRGDGRRGSAPKTGPSANAGKRAVTHLRPLERLREATLLECRLETGRTHQIRIHLSEAGHPVLGDVKYGQSGETTIESRPFPRIALHATTLGFDHPTTEKRQRFESPLPEDLRTLVERLREG